VFPLPTIETVGKVVPYQKIFIWRHHDLNRRGKGVRSPLDTWKVAGGRQKQTALFEELDVLIVQPEKEGGNQENGEQNEKNNSPPGEHYVTADGTPVGGMADTLTTMGTVSFRFVLHDHGYITNPAVCAKTRTAKTAYATVATNAY
jgi:hypothetical protein